MPLRYKSRGIPDAPPDFREVASEVLGTVDWQDEHTGYCDCPGAHRHTAPSRDRDCRVYLNASDGYAPTIYCFHDSCQHEIQVANHMLRSALGKASVRSSDKNYSARKSSVYRTKCREFGDPFEALLKACYEPRDIVSIAPGMTPDGESRSVPEHGGVNVFTRDEWIERAKVKGGIIGCNLNATVTQMIIKLQPKYRFALTATPIPNVISNIFSLMGWLCVPNWYRGETCNAAWPWPRDGIGDFERTFLSSKRDFTAEEIKQQHDPKSRGKCIKVSPIISSPTRLLKFLRPTLAFISKEQCNPALPPMTIHDIRVPMSAEQAKLYGYYMNLGNVPYPGRDGRRRKALQISILRALTAEPATCKWSKGVSTSNFTPKTAAILEIIRDLRGRGEQCVIVCARVGQSSQIERRLRDAGVAVARIDSTISPDSHSYQANLFKQGKAEVMIMGIKCAQGHSFDQCPNMIIGSLEYSYGSLYQAIGRVYRVTSLRPVNIWCVLHSDTIEEIMFDTVALKGDAATICLRGERVSRTYKPVSLDEVIAKNLIEFDSGKHLTTEIELEKQWPKLMRKIRAA